MQSSTILMLIMSSWRNSITFSIKKWMRCSLMVIAARTYDTDSSTINS